MLEGATSYYSLECPDDTLYIVTLVNIWPLDV